MDMIRRIIAITTVIALLVLVAPVKITISSQAAMVDDPLNTAIAPHFSRVVYTLTEPSYSTSCDDRGDFKALVGTPEISMSDSRLVVTPISSTKSSAVLSKTDVPGLNQTRAYYEMSFSVSNTLSWTNFSLYDLPNDWINISVHSGTFVYDYDSGTRQMGTFYSPAAAGADYVIAFDLTSSSVTIFLYGTNGTLLADKYISSNRLVAGDLDEIRFELQGSTSNALRLDYLYVLGSTTLPGTTSVSLGLEQINPDDLSEEKRIDLDPTSITLDQSLRQQIFGFEDVELDKKITDRELLNAIGQTNIHQQRGAGRLVAEGYKDLRGSIEDSLISYIAQTEKVETDEVYLVDYYMDYLQCKVKIDNQIVDKVVNEFKKTADPVTSAVGATLEERATTSTLNIPAYAQNISWNSAAGYLVAPLAVIVSDALRGMKDPFGIKDSQKWAQDKLDQIYQDTLDRYDLTINQTTALMRDWQRSTDEKYQQVRQDYLNFLSIAQAQTAQLASDYSEMQDKFERTISKFYSYTENQFEATNAIIAKLLLQNENFANSSQQISQYFAGQLAQTNEVILNISNTLTNALSGQDFWASVYSDGKPASEPLTFSGFFGNNVRTWTLIIIGVFVTIVVALVLITILKPGRRTRNRRQ
jgi:hypothetical protein